MVDVRSFLRYEIPGYLIFIYASLLIACFVTYSAFQELLSTMMLPAAISGFIVAIPVGWLVYQTYNSFFLKHYEKDSVKLIKKWATEENMSFPKGKAGLDTHYEELVNIGLYSKNDSGSFDVGYATETLRGYWDHHDARYIVAKYVPPVSAGFAAIILSIAWLAARDVVHLDIYDTPFRVSLVVALIAIISYIVHKPILRIRDEIQILESYLILRNKDQIIESMRLMKKERNEKPKG